MTSIFRDKWFRALVAWGGLWQLGHLILNIQYCFQKVDFPLPPLGGWSDQARLIFDGLVASDLLQSCVSLVAVAGYFAHKRWSLALGLVSLSSSVFNSLSFTYFIVATGAWAAHASHYWFIQILWAPLLLQMLWLCHHLSRLGIHDAPEAELGRLTASAPT